MNRVSLTTFVTSAAHWSPGQAPVPPMGATAWPCRPGARLSETVIAFACSCSCGIETPVAFTGAGRASAETVVAFAGAKWAFLVQFLGAEVMVVSMVAVWGRAVVMVVSMVAVQGRTVVMVVSMPPSCRASCAKKFALHARNTPKSAFLRLLGELFRGSASGEAVLGEFFRGNAAGGPLLGEFFRTN